LRHVISDLLLGLFAAAAILVAAPIIGIKYYENEGYIFHVVKWDSFFKYGFQAVMLQELPRASTPCRNCLVPTGDAKLEGLYLTGSGYEKTMPFQYLVLFASTLILRVISYFTVRMLIKFGNRRYHYVSRSAGGAATVAAGPSDLVGQSMENHLPNRVIPPEN